MNSMTRKWKPKPNDIRVRPESKKNLHHLAKLARSCIPESTSINVEKLLNEFSSQDILEYEVLDDDELYGNYAITNGSLISFSSSVMEAIADPSHTQHQRHRFTAAHEIGHALKHRYLTPQGLARREPPTKPYESAEWQADTFAGYLLIPNKVIENLNFDASEISKACNVSFQAAEIAVRKYVKF